MRRPARRRGRRGNHRDLLAFIGAANRRIAARPAEHRLVTDPGSEDQIVRATMLVRAKLWSGNGIRRATSRIGGGAPAPLAGVPGTAALWQATHPTAGPADGPHRLTVTAEDGAGATGQETSIVRIDRNGVNEAPSRRADGSDRDTVGAWPEKDLLGTRLGPNRNGRKW